MSEEQTTDDLSRVTVIALLLDEAELEGLRASAAVLERSLAGLRSGTKDEA